MVLPFGDTLTPPHARNLISHMTLYGEAADVKLRGPLYPSLFRCGLTSRLAQSDRMS
jgi:hypothetical protein